MYYQTDVEKKERRRIILISIATAILILVLLVAIIVVAAHKSARSGDEEIANQTNSGTFDYKEENKTEDKKDEKTETTQTESKPVITTDTAPAVTSTVSDMPTTGPEDILPLAILLGLGATFVTSYIMSKKNAYVKKARLKSRFFGVL